MTIVFQQNFDGTYDLTVDGRTREYDVEPEDIRGALRRARIKSDQDVYVEDETGHREPLKVRR